MDPNDDRGYVDVATQTSPFIPPLVAQVCSASPNLSFYATSMSSNSFKSLSNCVTGTESTTDTQTEAEQSPAFDHVSSLRIPKTGTSSSRMSSLSSSSDLQRYPTSGSRPVSSTNRTVSLPETLCDEGLRIALLQFENENFQEIKEQPRIVSMPAAVHVHSCIDSTPHNTSVIKHSLEELPLLDENFADNEDSRSNSSSLSTPRTIVLHSLSSDQFHTPSPPPSSCDSVEFTLDNSAHLPDSFLHGSASPPILVSTAATKNHALLEDDGWLTWASSPPRPIPALHGPSSLPYARCPSGAEGTIIGEQSSLPRMIWGLDPNDTVPTPHLSQQPQFQSRAIPIKSPLNIVKPTSGYDALQSETPVISSLASFPASNVGPRFSNADLDYSAFEEVQIGRGRLLSVPSTFRSGRETLQTDHWTVTKSGFDVKEGPMKTGSLHEHGVHDDRVTDYPQFYRIGASSGKFESLTAGKEENRCSLEVQDHGGKLRQPAYNFGSRREHPSNLIELVPSPVNILDHGFNMNHRAAPMTSQVSTPELTSNYLPTPPSSSSPQWSSVFSPLQNKRLTTIGYSHDIEIIPSSIARYTAHGEFSDELRRFFFEQVSSPAAADAFYAPETSYAAVSNVYPLTHNFFKSSSNGNPSRPTGLPISQHTVLSKGLEPFDPISVKTSSPLTSTAGSYTRSTLANPRSIPLSRLQRKRGALKLPTVPEEDSAEPCSQAHIEKTGPSSLEPLRLSLRASSPLDSKLHARSIEDRAIFGDEFDAGQVRVKLPQSTCIWTAKLVQNTCREWEQSIIPQGSPKKKRLQRRKKPTRPGVPKPGFPLVSEGTVTFSSVTKDD